MTMKCSHGVVFEVKCRMCFEEAMLRVSASGSGVVAKKVEAEEAQKLFRLGGVSEGSRLNPEAAVK